MSKLYEFFCSYTSLEPFPLLRNCHSPSLSWFMPPHVAAQMESSTQVSIFPACGARSRHQGLDGPAGHRMDRLHTLSQAILRAGPLSTSTGRKQDAWFVVDPESGETQITLTTEGPATPRLYIGRTRESSPSCSPSSGQPPLLLWPVCQFVSQHILH